MTFSDLFKVMNIQRQITWKWGNIQLYLRMADQKKKGVYIWSIERRHFQWPRTNPTFSFKVTPFFDAEYLRNGTTWRHSHWNTNRDLHTPYATVSFRMWPPSDLAKYSMTQSVTRPVSATTEILFDRRATFRMLALAQSADKWRFSDEGVGGTVVRPLRRVPVRLSL